jgi:hypothetical protein
MKGGEPKEKQEAFPWFKKNVKFVKISNYLFGKFKEA